MERSSKSHQWASTAQEHFRDLTLNPKTNSVKSNMDKAQQYLQMNPFERLSKARHVSDVVSAGNSPSSSSNSPNNSKDRQSRSAGS